MYLILNLMITVFQNYLISSQNLEFIKKNSCQLTQNGSQVEILISASCHLRRRTTYLHRNRHHIDFCPFDIMMECETN